MQSAKKMCGYGREITKAGLGSLAFHTDGLALDPFPAREQTGPMVNGTDQGRSWPQADDR